MLKFQEKKFISDVLAKQADIVYKKVFIFMAVSGGSWIYGVKTDGYFGLVIWFAFTLSTVGVIANLGRMGILYKDLEEIKYGES